MFRTISPLIYTYIVNNYYTMTKNKQVHHARVSKLMKWRGSTEPFHQFTILSVINLFVFGHGVGQFLKKKKNSPDVRRVALCHFVNLVNISVITPQKDITIFATIAVHFVGNYYFSCPLFHLSKAA